MLVGAGALHATDEVIAVADRLGAGVAKALLGKAALPDDLPWVTGSIGLLGTKPSWEMMTELRHAADDRLRLPLLRIPAEGRQARGVQIDIAAGHAEPALSDGGQSARRQQPRRCARCCRCCSEQATGPGARRSRRTSPTGGQLLRGARHAARRPGQPAARVLGIVAAPARRRDHHQRFRLRAPTGTRAT